MSGRKKSSEHFIKKPPPPKGRQHGSKTSVRKRLKKPPPPPLPLLKPSAGRTTDDIPNNNPKIINKSKILERVTQSTKTRPFAQPKNRRPSETSRFEKSKIRKPASDVERSARPPKPNSKIPPRNRQPNRNIRGTSSRIHVSQVESPLPVRKSVSLNKNPFTKKDNSIKNKPASSLGVAVKQQHSQRNLSNSTPGEPKKRPHDQGGTHNESYLDREIERLRSKSRKYNSDYCSLIFALTRSITNNRLVSTTHHKYQRRLDERRRRYFSNRSLEDKEAELAELESEIIKVRKRFDTSLRNLKDDEIFDIIEILSTIKDERSKTTQQFEEQQRNLSKELEEVRKLKDYLYVNAQIRDNLSQMKQLDSDVEGEKKKIEATLKTSILHESMFDITNELSEMQKRFEMKMNNDRQINDLLEFESRYFSDPKGETRKKYFQDYKSRYKEVGDVFAKHMLFFAVVSEGDGLLRTVCEKVPFLEIKKRYYNVQEKQKERDSLNERVEQDFNGLNLKNDQRVDKLEKLNTFLRKESQDLINTAIFDCIKFVNEVALPQFRRIEWSQVNSSFESFQSGVEGELRSVTHELTSMKKDLSEIYKKNDTCYGKIFDKEEKGVMNIFRKKRKLMYYGILKDGKANGLGREFYEDGKTLLFYGNFRDGKRHGRGEIYDRKGEVTFKGDWEDGENKAEVYDSTHLEFGELCPNEGESVSNTPQKKGMINAIFYKKSIFRETIMEHIDSMKEVYLKRSFAHAKNATPKEVAEVNLQDFKKNVLDNNQEKLRCFVGKGTFSDVYRLELEGKVYAFKHFHGVMSREEQKQLQDELDLMKSLSHPHLIRVYGVSTKEPNGIITELCKESISKVIDNCHEKKRSLTIDEKLDLLLQVCLGMEYLHANNVIHRDLKWENVLIMEDMIVKIIDFGFSKSVHDIGASVRNTVGRVGTPQYIAPEILTGKGNYKYPCDVFSFGIMFYELIFETLDPYDLANRENYFGGIEYQVANKGTRPKMMNLPYEQKWISKLIQRCWNQDQKKRPTFRDVIKDILTFWVGGTKL